MVSTITLFNPFRVGGVIIFNHWLHQRLLILKPFGLINMAIQQLNGNWVNQKKDFISINKKTENKFQQF